MAEEVGREPLRRTILNQDIVLYRGTDGRAAALQNRCAHRSYPLSKGHLKGNRIVCPYHGMEFGSDGRCAFIPSQDVIPEAMRVQAYPIVEQGSFVWIWTGAPESASRDKLVSQPWFTEPGWAHVAGYYRMKANYLGLHENLLDLSHFPFVHGIAVGKPEHAGARPEFEIREGAIISSVLHRDVAVGPAFAAAAQMTPPIHRLSEQIVPTPAIHLGKAIYTDASQPRKRFVRYIVHYPTPETATSTHYFWGVARDVGLEDAAVEAESYAIANKAFDEDRQILEDIEAVYQTDHRPDFREKIIATDRGGIQLLRLFAAKAQAEGEMA